MADGDLRQKLLGSDAVASLLSENRIAETLRALKWRPVQGFYYEDAATQKFREVDILATVTQFGFGEGTRLADAAAIELVVECKTLRETNIVFSDYAAPFDSLRTLYRSPPEMVRGVHEGAILEVVASRLNALIGAPHSETMFERLLDRYQGFLRDKGVYSLVLLPPESENTASSYREIVGITEKNVDASVLWRAFQSVHSALAFLKEDARKSLCDQAAETLNSARDRNRTFYEAAALAIVNGFAHAYYFHPVLVTESKLWKLTSPGISQVNHFRFWQTDRRGMPFRWIDIVHLDAFQSFAERVGSYYRQALENLGYTNSRQSLSDELYSHLVS